MLGGILASRHGLTALVVERRDGPQTSPAAHEVNARTSEICRQAGLDMPIHAAAKDPVDSGHVNFVTRLTGQLIGHLPFERQGEACLEYTPTPLRNLPQHRFEPILVDELRSCPGVELRYGQQWERSEEVDGAVVSTITDRATDATTESVDDYDDRRCHEIIDRAAGVAFDAEILGRGTWWMTSQTAESMGSGQVFLAGFASGRGIATVLLGSLHR